MITTEKPSSVAFTSPPTFVLGPGLPRAISVDDATERGLLGAGYSFDPDSVLNAAESHDLSVDQYLANFLHTGFLGSGYRSAVTVMVEVDYLVMNVWACSPRHSLSVPFLAKLGALVDYGRGIVSAGARPYGHWQGGMFHRVHPAAITCQPGAVETFGGLERYTTFDSELRSDLLARPSAYGWWSPVDLSGPMLVPQRRGAVAIPQALYVWSGEPSE